MGLLDAMRHVGGRALSLSVEIAMPPVCAGCGISSAWMCSECERQLVSVDPATACRRCGHPAEHGPDTCRRCRTWSPELTAVRAAYEFDGPARAAIHRVKYRGEYARAAWCAAEMRGLLTALPVPPDAICAVPLARRRRRTRGFNQSEVIARTLAEQVGLPFVDALERTRDTSPQVGLSAAERQTNVLGAFQARMPLDGAVLAIVDDVLTTGATLRACASAASRAGAAEVFGLVLATDAWR